MLMTIIGILVGLVILGCAVVALYISMQGDAKMRLLTKKRTDAVKVSEAGDRLDFQLEVPFDNIGKQEGTILDTYMRIYLPQEQYDDVLLRGKVNLEGVLRDDDYFEALLVPAGTGKNLVAGDMNALDVANLLKRLEHHNHHDSCAVGVGDDATRTVQGILSVTLGHHQGHVVVHAESA